MWIVMNNSFVSIVEDRNVKGRVAVRARVENDLIALFPNHKNEIITTDDSDYRFRLFLDKKYVSEIVANRILNIEYDNFKDSVKQGWRKKAYMAIWSVMYDVQDTFYPNQSKWWMGYRN